MAPRGRRAGSDDTRTRILDAARDRFAADGYAGATIRSIAAQAGVDPALVHHYFGPKTQLFAELFALPVDLHDVVGGVLDGPVEHLGERIIRTFLHVWESPEGGTQLRGLLRAAVTEDHAAATLREFLLDAVLGPVARRVDLPQAELRAALAASQIMGLAMARYVIGFPPLVSTDADTLVAAYAPTLQRYLTGDLATPG